MADYLKNNIVGIHQPNFLPWLGYFVKIDKSDTFVFHDQVEFSKKSFTKRVKIRSHFDSLETKYLTVPLVAKSDFTLIKDIEISNAVDWRKKQLAQIQHAYRQCKFFPEWFENWKTWYANSVDIEYLAEMNIYFIKSICEELGISSNFSLSSGLEVVGKKDELNFQIVKRLEGDAYCSGTGGAKYYDPKLYAQQEIEFYLHRTFEELEEKPYLSDAGKFVNGLSILDALFYLGTEATVRLIKSIPLVKPGY